MQAEHPEALREMYEECMFIGMRTMLIIHAIFVLLSSRGEGQSANHPFVHGQTAGSERQGNPPSRFIRIVDGGDSASSALELAIVRFGTPGCGGSCPRVDLIAVAHIAGHGFYRKINQLLPSYDVVLYEFVAPDSALNPAMISREQYGPMYRVYSMIAGILGLENQMDGIDYGGANMLHADMTRSEFQAMLEEKGEKFPDLEMLTAELDGSLPPGLRNPDEIDLGMRCRYRRMAASKLLKPGDGEGIFGDVHIIPRNDIVLRILEEQLVAGRKKIAILYGAGHMSDLQDRLLSKFGMQPLKRRWLTAWDLCKTTR
jgi:hypothetical protein